MTAAVLAVALAGCGDDGPARRDADAVSDDAPWRTSSAPVATGGLAWATGATVRLGDSTTIDTVAPVRAFLVGGDGVFFVPLERDEDDADFAEAPLWFARAGEEPEDTGLRVASDGVAVTPDGETLVVLESDTDTGTAAMRFFDLLSGDEAVSEDGMDISGIDDPVDHLLESEVEILEVTDDHVVARVIEGDVVYDLATGEGRVLTDGEQEPVDSGDPAVSPDEAWRIDRRDGLRDAFVGADGDVLPDAGAPRWTLSSWIDASTAVGVAIEGPGTGDTIGPDDSLTLLTCTVPSGACRPLSGTTGERVVLPLRTEPTSVIDLRPRGDS